MRSAWLLALALVACWKSRPSTDEPVTQMPVEITVSSVTLGNDCGPPEEAESERQSKSGARARVSEDEAECVQTALQLAIKAGAQASALRVKKVELVAPDGKVQTLRAFAPTTWSQRGVYKPWDQSIAANTAMQVSYSLASPSWAALGGRWEAAGKTFQVRVTLAIDSAERVFVTEAAVPAHIEPMIET
jgi:hypothetical protein